MTEQTRDRLHDVWMAPWWAFMVTVHTAVMLLKCRGRIDVFAAQRDDWQEVPGYGAGVWPWLFVRSAVETTEQTVSAGDTSTRGNRNGVVQ